MAGVPSIVYGFFGLILIVPLIRQIFGGTGTSMLAACVLLGMMILPTIIGVTESAIRSVPESYYEGSLALGATKERSIFFVMLPAAKSGILAATISTHIKNIRSKLNKLDIQPIETVWGIGYKWE